jgi:hypothetical protein
MYVGLGNIALWCLGNLFLLVIEMDEEAYLVILYQFWRGVPMLVFGLGLVVSAKYRLLFCGMYVNHIGEIGLMYDETQWMLYSCW